MGASGGSVLGSVRNLNEVIEEQAGVTATLAPSTSGAAAAGVIALAGNTTLSRVSIALNPVKGRIVLVGMDNAGDQVDLSTPEGASKLVLDKTVDGTETTLSVDVSKLTVKAILIYWVPDIPGDTLTLTRIGVFTRDPVAPPANPAPPVSVATPPPVIPPAEVVQAMAQPVSAGAASPVSSSTTQTTGSGASTTASSTPPILIPNSSPVSL